MSDWLVGFVTLIYVGVAVTKFAEGQIGLSLAFAGYAIANVGLIMASRV